MKVKKEYIITKEELKLILDASEKDGLLDFVGDSLHYMKYASPSTWEETEHHIDEILTVIRR